ncbi:MAG: peroxiredoxin family protein, partial [Muribaculaceae bacterium]|nr:peroxiredoxin family protein [Muribaculaceae bacterium]
TTSDYKYFAAVATGFNEKRPDDPHTALLEQTSLNALKNRNREKGTHLQIEAEEVKMIDISLPDENGKTVKLSDVADNGKKTVLIFSLLTHPDSPALNMELARIFNAQGGNVDFYQVSLDPDQYAWRDAAKNLPWTTVFDPDGEYSKAAVNYNVGQLPAFFIFSTSGDLVNRATSVDDLRKKL